MPPPSLFKSVLLKFILLKGCLCCRGWTPFVCRVYLEPKIASIVEDADIGSVSTPPVSFTHHQQDFPHETVAQV